MTAGPINMRSEVALAHWARALTRSALQEMLTATVQPGTISFALGLPAPELFPTADFAAAAAHVLAGDERALQYGPHLTPLRRQVVELMKLRGVACLEEQVFLTAGAQQGMSLLAHLLLEPGSTVITEELIYTGFQQVLEPFRPEVLTVPTDPQTGMDVEAVAELLRRGVRPAFIYVITEGHNPLSVSLHPAKRAWLVELAEQYAVPILEDDAYGLLSYEQAAAPLRALSERWVFYVGSFSKILAPALRAGWVVVPEELILPLSVAKEAADIDTATFAQRVVSAYLDTGRLPAHITTLRHCYRERRDVMLRALEEHFPAEASWREPTGGVFIWLELPAAVDVDELFKTALESEKVAFLPGHAFSIQRNRNQPPSMRLNFSHAPPAQIAEGILRLARVLKGGKLR